MTHEYQKHMIDQIKQIDDVERNYLKEISKFTSQGDSDRALDLQIGLTQYQKFYMVKLC